VTDNPKGPVLSFLRHRKSINPMNDECLKIESLETRSGPKAAPFIVLMSFSWLFLGGLLSSRAHLRFTNWENYANLGRTWKV